MTERNDPIRFDVRLEMASKLSREAVRRFVAGTMHLTERREFEPMIEPVDEVSVFGARRGPSVEQTDGEFVDLGLGFELEAAHGSFTSSRFGDVDQVTEALEYGQGCPQSFIGQRFVERICGQVVERRSIEGQSDLEGTRTVIAQVQGFPRTVLLRRKQKLRHIEPRLDLVECLEASKQAFELVSDAVRHWMRSDPSA